MWMAACSDCLLLDLNLLITVVAAFPAPARLAVLLFAGLPPAIVAALRAAVLPHGDRDHLQCLHRILRIIAGDDEFAGMRQPFGRDVANGHTEA